MFELWRVCLTRDIMEDEFMSKKNVGRGIFYVFEWRLLGDKSLWDDLGATGRRYEDFMSTLRCVIKFGRFGFKLCARNASLEIIE